MAYNDTNIARLTSLFKRPGSNYRKILPFINSRIRPMRRRFLEILHIDRLSKPYLGHEKLLAKIQKLGGFFVEVGGNDGYLCDPTYYLEKFRGWNGIIVEPLPIYRLCQKNRRGSRVYNCAVGPADNKERETVLVECNAMTFVKGSIENEEEWVSAGESSQKISAKTITVPIRPLQEVIDEYFHDHPHRHIDLLTIDVEGYELEVLKGIDFSKNKPAQIMVEAHTEERLEKIRLFLKPYLYKNIEHICENDYLIS